MSPEPARNLVHLALLAAWAVLGIVMTFGALFHPAAAPAVGVFWLWWVGFAVVTTVLVARTASPLGALAMHGLVLVILAVLPRIFPLSLLRAGLDILARG